MDNKKIKNNLENAEYGVDSRYISDKERDMDATALMEARLIRMKNLSPDQIINAKLMQLYLKMEDFISKVHVVKRNSFSDFLATYIDTIYTKRTSFASDIDIAPVSLSQIINNHREPNEEFILRLMIHSEMVYKNFSRFNKEIWYEVYFHEKISDTMASQEKWRPQVVKHVKLCNSILK